MDFTKSKALQHRSHNIIPGGCHTYAKGDDQYPVQAPAFLARGKGCHVWDVDGNEFIEYGMGLRTVTLGHAFPPVIEAAAKQMESGANFNRPTPIEVEAGEKLLSLIEGAAMVQFAKNGSDVNDAAIRVARAYTGRDRVGICGDHPFFSVSDWFIGTTPMNAGIPQAVQDLTVKFRYNDIDSVRDLFDQYPGEVACLIMEPGKYEPPKDGFLHEVKRLCSENGAVFILDEMITGFRYHLGGAQRLYDVIPDLSTFGKALGNVDGILINPGAFTHTSVAIRDALLAVSVPTIEVHLSNIHAREEFRRRSLIADVVTGQVTGLGVPGVLRALDILMDLVEEPAARGPEE